MIKPKDAWDIPEKRVGGIHMKRQIGFFAILLVFLLCACATTEQKKEALQRAIQQKRETLQKTWEGRNVNDLIAYFGPPSEVLDDGKGGRILIYTKTIGVGVPGQSFSTYHGISRGSVTGFPGGASAHGTDSGTQFTYTSPEVALSISGHRMFWVNKEGTIYRVELQIR